jgi:polyribonucleotide nucleotidyltransferase
MNMAESKARRAAQVLMGLLDRQRQLYRHLQSLVERQAELVSAGNPDGLLQVLAQRQALLEDVKRTNDSLLPFRQRWDAVCQMLDEQQRAQVTEAIDEINERLQTMMQRDQRDTEMLRLRCRRIGHQLQTARAQRAAVQAYDATGGRDLRVNEAVE